MRYRWRWLLYNLLALLPLAGFGVVTARGVPLVLFACGLFLDAFRLSSALADLTTSATAQVGAPRASARSCAISPHPRLHFVQPTTSPATVLPCSLHQVLIRFTTLGIMGVLVVGAAIYYQKEYIGKGRTFSLEMELM